MRFPTSFSADLGFGRVVAFILASASVLLSGCASGDRLRRPPTVDLDERAMNIWQAIRAGDPVQMGRDFDPRVDRAFSKPDRAAFLGGLRQKYGRAEEMRFPVRRRKYEAVYPLRFERGELEMRLSTNERFAVIGLTIAPPKPATSVRNRTPISFPLEGIGVILWAPEGSEPNPRADSEAQRFALEIGASDSSGRVRKAGARENREFSCFGRNVRAPAGGTVIEAVDGVRDNRVGEPNPLSALGNAVMIEHAPGENSVLAHLKQGSVRVRAGQRVRRDQIIGQCGNSGNSMEPQLAYYMQDEAALQKGNPVQTRFERVRKLGKGPLAEDSPERAPFSPGAETLSDYWPARGDSLEDASPSRRAIGK